ncbi:MAG TPA: helix-turn-helix domain-containing protein [Verrucomicrobiae bacterium]|jgi:excisionase family DNA binding protein|nr:helix-turn-helix domain-containing protein [Verrucomicrobiae bacterium]
MNIEAKPEASDESLRVTQAAKILNVSSRTVWRMIADGQLTASRFRRCTRLLRSQVLGYLKGNGKVGGV